MSQARYCSECGAAIQPRARFCGSCGARVEASTTQAPEPAEALSTGGGLTASDAVYLYPEYFVEKDSLLTDGIDLGTSSVKLQKKPLARTMVLAAVASLWKNGWVDLPIVQYGALVFKQDAPALRKLLDGPCSLGGLESALFQKIEGGEDSKNLVGVVVARALGIGTFDLWGMLGQASSSSQGRDPWRMVVDLVGSHLQQTGHLLKAGGRLRPNGPLVAASSGEAGRVRALLEEFRSADPRRWDLLVKQVDQTLEQLKLERH